MDTGSVIVEEEANGGLALVIEDEAPVAEAAAGPHVLNLRPSRVRLACLLIVAVYPLITTLLYVLMPLTDGWDIWHRTIVITPVMVLSIVFIVAPVINRHLGWFIVRQPRPAK